MTTPCFPGMFYDPQPHRWVPDTSKAAHREAVATGRVNGRIEDVLLLLQDHTEPVTSAELAGGTENMRWLLWVRRGLSDAHKVGMVAKGANRLCRETNRECNTWKKVTR